MNQDDIKALDGASLTPTQRFVGHILLNVRDYLRSTDCVRPLEDMDIADIINGMTCHAIAF